MFWAGDPATRSTFAAFGKRPASSSLLNWQPLLFVSAILVSSSAQAIPLEFTPERDGHLVRGAEVCFFRAIDTDDPVAEFLSSDEVRCLSADQVIELPTGRWSYYLRHREEKLAYFAPSVIRNNAVQMREAGYNKIVDEIRPAATFDFSRLWPDLAGDERIGAYILNEGTRYPAALVPVPRGDKSFLAPADSTVVILGVRDGDVVDLSEPLRASSGETKTVAHFKKPTGHIVVGWIVFSSAGRTPGEHWRNLAAPSVKLVQNVDERNSSIPLRGSYGADRSLLLFPDVPEGNWKLKLDGDLWKPDEVAVSVPSVAVVVNATRPLTTSPAAAVTARWTSKPPLPPVSSDCADASSKPRPPTQPIARLLACVSLQPGLDLRFLDPRTCRSVKNGDADFQTATARFRGVEPGSYVVEIIDPIGRQARATITLAPAEARRVDLEMGTFDFFGRVTLDGKPIHARLEFAGGITVSDSDGRYTANLARSPGALPVKVLDCAETKLIATHVPVSPIQSNGPYDISIISTVLHVRVADRSSGSGISGATVQAGVLTSPAGGGHFLEDVPRTDEHGEAAISNVPAKQMLTICALADDYERACADDFSLDGAREKDVTIALHKTDSRTGRIVGPPAIVNGWIALAGGAGDIVASGAIASDGTFPYPAAADRAEYVVVTAANLPLTLIPMPKIDPANVQIALPSASIVDIDVSSTRQHDGLIGLYVGDRYVPFEAFFHHQNGHGMQSVMMGGGPLRIPAVARTDTLRIMLGPPPGELRGVHGDVFMRPDLVTGRPIKPVGADGRVVFD
jgi:hypothetical protein